MFLRGTLLQRTEYWRRQSNLGEVYSLMFVQQFVSCFLRRLKIRCHQAILVSFHLKELFVELHIGGKWENPLEVAASHELLIEVH